MYEVKRGEVWEVDLGETIGSEQGGIRPCIIVQNDTGNKHSTTTIVVPITKQEKHKIPTHCPVFGLPYESIALCEQVRTVEKSRVMYRRSNVKFDSRELNKSLRISVGLWG